jgi:hypothetical protein
MAVRRQQRFEISDISVCGARIGCGGSGGAQGG